MHNEPTLLLLGGNVSIIIDITNINIQNLFVKCYKNIKKLLDSAFTVLKK